MPTRADYDFIIAGAGSAGCALARRLSDDPGVRVLLLEAGGRDVNPLLRVPMMTGLLLRNRYARWCYSTEPECHLNDRRIFWPRGKSVRRLVGDQRHGLHARLPVGLRWMGADGTQGLVLRRCDCPTSSARGFPRRRRRAPWHGRSAPHLAAQSPNPLFDAVIDAAGRRDTGAAPISTARRKRDSAATISRRGKAAAGAPPAPFSIRCGTAPISPSSPVPMSTRLFSTRAARVRSKSSSRARERRSTRRVRLS